MTDKQIIIDYKNLCENYSEEVGCYGTFDGNCIKEQCFTYKLLQLLQAKEQECEELKEAQKNSRCAWKSFEGTFCPEAQEQLDQLKAENDELKIENKRFEEVASYWHKRIFKVERSERKLKQTLTEIKDIAERGFKHSQCNCGAKADLDLILQKISEVEND
jgi:hypothetical protein